MLLPLAAFILAVVLTFFLPNLPVVEAWDRHAISWIAAHRVGWLTDFFRVITWLGGIKVFFVVLLIPPSLYFLNRRWGLGLYYLLGVGLIKVSVAFLKILVGRPRPAEALELLKDLSMPSGHAANVVLIYGLVGMFCLREIPNQGLKWFAFTLCMVMILLIDFSRVYLGVHYPSDVVMGSLYAAAGLWVLKTGRKKIFGA